MMIKAVCNRTPFTVETILPRAGLELGTDRSIDQGLTHWATGAPVTVGSVHLCQHIV